MQKLKILLAGYLLDVIAIVAYAMTSWLSSRTDTALIFVIAAVVLVYKTVFDTKIVEVEEDGEVVYYTVRLNQLLFDRFYQRKDVKK